MMKKARGFIVVLLGILMLTLLGIGGLVIDVGYVLRQKILLQRAADNATLAAAVKVQSTDALVTAEAITLLTVNDVQSDTEVRSIECGQYNPTNRGFMRCNPVDIYAPCSSCSSGGTNAVRLKLVRYVPAYLSHVLGISTIAIHADSVAQAVFQNSGNCIRPFGIVGEGNHNPLQGVSVGQTFSVGGNSSGNWGKLDIGGNMSSGKNFSDAMLNGACPNTIKIGDRVSAATGFGGPISSAFNDLVSANKMNGLTFAVISSMPNGNSGDVNVLEFITLDFLSQSSQGTNWQGTFRLAARGVTPPVGGGNGVLSKRYLVYAVE